MFDKIYISADNLEKENEIEKFRFLFNERNPYEIWKYSIKVGESFEGKIYDVAILEIFLFYNYLINKGYRKEDIEILSNKALFIRKDDLYKIEDGEVIKLKTSNVGFFSLRASNWNNPFFFILNKIITKKGGMVSRTNNLNLNIYGNGKFYGLNSLYNKREKYIGDLIIPYKIKEKDYPVFIKYIKKNFSTKIVVKKDFTCAGEGVYVIDLENFNQKQQDKFNVAIKNNYEYYKGLYITPYYDFQEEYRFYFTKYNGKIKIFSFKTKKVMSPIEDILNADTFLYQINVKIKWEYVQNKDWDKYKKMFKLARKYIKNLEYTTGTLEFGKTQNGEIIFFEVNPMSATLCFTGEDEKNMNNYYTDLFENIISENT